MLGMRCLCTSSKVPSGGIAYALRICSRVSAQPQQARVFPVTARTRVCGSGKKGGKNAREKSNAQRGVILNTSQLLETGLRLYTPPVGWATPPCRVLSHCLYVFRLLQPPASRLVHLDRPVASDSHGVLGPSYYRETILGKIEK